MQRDWLTARWEYRVGNDFWHSIFLNDGVHDGDAQPNMAYANDVAPLLPQNLAMGMQPRAELLGESRDHILGIDRFW